jgi:hypothetical protein
MNTQRRRSLNVNTCINTFKVEEHRIGQDLAEGGDKNLLPRKNVHQRRAASNVDSGNTRTKSIDAHEIQLEETIDNLLTFFLKKL